MGFWDKKEDKVQSGIEEEEENAFYISITDDEGEEDTIEFSKKIDMEKEYERLKAEMNDKTADWIEWKIDGMKKLRNKREIMKIDMVEE